jgi:hypothetical protein
MFITNTEGEINMVGSDHLGYTDNERGAILNEIGNLAQFIKGASETGASASEVLDELRVAMALRIGMVAQVITLAEAEYLMDTFEAPQELLNELKAMANQHYVNQFFGK